METDGCKDEATEARKGGDPVKPGGRGKGGGLRFNGGKPRHDLVPPRAQEEYIGVLTRGAEKYAERNWERGMPWMSVLASLKRHVHAFERGEDRDPESGLLHMAHVMTNAAFLCEYYSIYPHGDDRPHYYLSRPKVSLDIDDVIADFVGHWQAVKREGKEPPGCWNFDSELHATLHAMRDDEDFWMSIPRKVDPADIPFEAHCYITNRAASPEITRKWLLKNGFPDRPVYHVPPGGSKADAFRETGADWHVDDSYEVFVDMSRAGICCWLMSAPHNQRYEVGFKRIGSLADLAH